MMKKSRRLLAILICFVLAFTTAFSVFAEGEEGKSKIENDSAVVIEEILNESDNEEIDDLKEPEIEQPESNPSENEIEVPEKTPTVENSNEEEKVELPKETTSSEKEPETVEEKQDSEEETEGKVEPKTVNFSDAGPFLPAVNIGVASRMSNNLRSNRDGLELSKNVTYDGVADKYKITLESYVTGEVTTTTKTVPVDIVLVLDQSGSMAENIQSGVKRQAAMKQAVNKFIDGVAANYDTDGDHRISIVTFGSSATQKSGWTFVDSAGQTALKSSINGLPTNPSGATQIDLGMKEAEKLINAPAYTGVNTTRQQVVVVFTDGFPTSSNGFETNVANNAIATSKNLKDKGVTVYSVGIFGGANPKEMYGKEYREFEWSWFSWKLKKATACTGLPNSKWGWHGSDSGSADPDIAAANRFLNILSSNVSSESALGATRTYKDPLIGTSEHYWNITKQITPDKTGYYLSASDTASLEDVFKSIQEQIATPAIILGTDTVMIDELSDAVKLPAGATKNDIKVYTSEKTASGWDTPVPLINPDVEIVGKEVKVKGFDYSENFVSDNPRTQGSNPNFYGKKLIVEFEIEPDYTKTFGGSNIETNTADSGIYEKDGSAVGGFTIPKANFPVNYEMETKNQSIYLGNGVEISGLIDYKAGYTPDGTNNSGVDIVYEIYKGSTKTGTYTIPAGAVPGDSSCSYTWETGFDNGEDAIENCQEYDVKCNVKPIVSGTEINLDKKANAHVFVPQIDFDDKTLNLGESADLKDLYTLSNWVEASGHTSIPAPTTTKPLVEIEILAEYDFWNGCDEGVQVGSVVTPLKIGDYNFVMVVKIGNKDVTSLCELTLPTCTTGSHAAGRHFTVHVNGNDLVIDIDGAEGNSNQSFIVEVVRKTDSLSANFPSADYTYQVALVPDSNGEYKAVIKDLPIGDYEIKFDKNWEWRYKGVQTETVTLTGGVETQNYKDREVNNKQWLGSPAESKVNNFAQIGTPPVLPSPINVKIFGEGIQQ